MSVSPPPLAPDLAGRYRAATELTAPRMLDRLPGAGVEGYWVGPGRYFVVDEVFDEDLGGVAPQPTLWDLATSDRRAFRLDDLLPVLSRASRGLDRESLAQADFDMPDPTRLAVTLGGSTHLIGVTDGHLAETHAAPPKALYAPNRRRLARIADDALQILETAPQPRTIATLPSGAGLRLGRPSETSLAAVSERRTPRPLGLWSPDSAWFLTHEIDERATPEIALVEHAPPEGGGPRLHAFRYGTPADPPPTGTFVAVHAPSGRTVRLDGASFEVAAFSPFHLQTVGFLGDAQAWFVRQDRYARDAELLILDLTAGAVRSVLREDADAGYVDLHPCFAYPPNLRILRSTGEVVWWSERDGWGHLYLFDLATGALKAQVTEGDWQVRDLLHVDPTTRQAWFLAGGRAPGVDRARRRLCVADLDGGGTREVLAHDGDLAPVRDPPGRGDQDRAWRAPGAPACISPDGRFAALRRLSLGQGPRLELVSLTGAGSPHAVVQGVAAPGPAPRQVRVWAADGATELFGVLHVPPDFDPGRRYPLVDCIYPGPQQAAQPQTAGFSRSARARALAALGFVTLELDSRGAPVGNRAFHQAGYGALLEPQLADHAAAVRQLCAEHPFLDSARVGVVGSSAGGAAAARALFDYGDVFKVGVAAAGNHDSGLYAAVWSDRYRGPPEGWRDTPNAAAAERLSGALLLIAGDMDENVPLSQTLALAKALIAADRDFELLVVPGAGHDVLTTHGYAQRRMWDFLVRHLLALAPPPAGAVLYAARELARYHKISAQEGRY